MFGFKKKMKLPDGIVITHEMLIPIDEYFAAVENELYKLYSSSDEDQMLRSFWSGYYDHMRQWHAKGGKPTGICQSTVMAMVMGRSPDETARDLVTLQHRGAFT